MVGFCRIVLLFSLFNLVLCDSCEPNQGTEGIYDCVRIPKYDGYQWAICLSNQALETQTSRKMDCKGSLFCWLPCAQSIYPNSNREHIPKECKCDPDENERRKRSLLAKGSESKVNIPTACYVPTWKNSCNWYSKCLEAHSSCEGSDYNYAISYGEAICSIFQRRYNSLTIAGRSWIRSSQKCIQDLMRSAFMPNNTEKCKDIRNLAYEIHSDCYIQKGEFCKLSGSDQLTIYWSIKQLYEHAFSEKFDEGMAKFRSCLQNDPKQEQRKFMFYIEKPVNHSIDENTFASKIAEKFNFASHGLDWDVNKAFSTKHKRFYKSQEYQVVQMFLSKRQVMVIKRRKRQSNHHLIELAKEGKLSKLFMDELAALITYGYRIEDLKLVGIIVEKYNVSCSHSRAYGLFIRSILLKDTFSASECGTLSECTSGVELDEKASSTNTMGYYAENTDSSSNRMYYLKTNEPTIIDLLLEHVQICTDNSKKSKKKNQVDICQLLKKSSKVFCQLFQTIFKETMFMASLQTALGFKIECAF